MFIVPLARVVIPLLLGGLFALNSMYNLPAKDNKAQIMQTETAKKPIPEELLGQWINDKEIDTIINNYGDIPVIVKGGGDRGVFPISEIKNEKAFLQKHPSIMYIREVWIPSKHNLKTLKETNPDKFKWFEHINLEKSSDFMPLSEKTKKEIYNR